MSVKCKILVKLTNRYLHLGTLNKSILLHLFKGFCSISINIFQINLTLLYRFLIMLTRGYGIIKSRKVLPEINQWPHKNTLRSTVTADWKNKNLSGRLCNLMKAFARRLLFKPNVSTLFTQ